MASFEFWQKWLLSVCCLFIIFGIAVALLSWSPLFYLLNKPADDLFWPGSTPDVGTQQLRLWFSGVLGGTIAGWGLTLAFLVNGPFKRKEKWSKDAIVAGLALWFVLDTFMSLYTQAYFNVVFNVLAIAIAGLPLAMTSKEFL